MANAINQTITDGGLTPAVAIEEMPISMGLDIQKPRELETTTLTEVRKTISGDELKGVIKQIRETPDQKERQNMKTKLPWFSLAKFGKKQWQKSDGKEYCTGGRNAESIDYTIGICLDYDGLADHELEQLKERLSEVPWAYFGFTSPNGGYKVIALFDAPYRDKVNYTHLYKTVQRYTDMKLGFSSDVNTCDMGRVIFFSWDPEPYFKPDAMLIIPESFLGQADKNVLKASVAPEELLTQPPREPVTEQRLADIESAVSHLCTQKIAYNHWLKAGMALQSYLGEGGKRYWDRFLDNPHYDDTQKDMDRRWKSFRANGRITINSLFWVAEQYGWVNPQPPNPVGGQGEGFTTKDVKEGFTTKDAKVNEEKEEERDDMKVSGEGNTGFLTGCDGGLPSPTNIVPQVGKPAVKTDLEVSVTDCPQVGKPAVKTGRDASATDCPQVGKPAVKTDLEVSATVKTGRDASATDCPQVGKPAVKTDLEVSATVTTGRDASVTDCPQVGKPAVTTGRDASVTNTEAGIRCLQDDYSDIFYETKSIPLIRAELPGFLKEYLDLTDEITDAQDGAKLTAILPVIAVNLGNRVFIRTPAGKIFPNIWAVIIGTSSVSRKTTVINHAMETLKPYEDKLAGKCAKDIAKETYILNNVTANCLLHLLSEQPNRILRHNEISAFLADMGRSYNEGMKQKITDLFDGGRTFNATLQRTDIIKDPSLSIVAASTEGWFHSQLSNRAEQMSGFTQRFLYAIVNVNLEELNTDYRDCYLQAEELNRYDEMYEVFRSIPGSFRLKLSDGAIALRDKVYREKLQEVMNRKNEILGAYFSRIYDGYLYKFCLIITLCNSWKVLRGAIAEQKVNEFFAANLVCETVMKQALYLCGYYFENTLPLLTIMSENGKLSLEKKFVSLLKESFEGNATHSQMMRYGHFTAKDMKQAVDTLLEMGVIDMKAGNGTTGKKSTVYTLSQKYIESMKKTK